MKPELAQRREETWYRLVINGQKYGKVTEDLARKYNVTESAIEHDIAKIDEWLPKLDKLDYSSGISRIREIRKNRQRLQQMADEARSNGDLKKELSIRRQIESSIDTDISLTQSLGMTDKESDELDINWRDYMGDAPEEKQSTDGPEMDEDRTDDNLIDVGGPDIE